jgi:D-arginine dehydrogenase
VSEVDVAVLGGGVAGASLAFHLAVRGVAATVIERGETLGEHASGRNARLVMRSFASPLLRALTTASAAAYGERAAQIGFHASGSLLLGDEQELAARRDGAAADRLLAPQAARSLVPLLAGDGALRAALHTPGDGVLDPLRLLAWYRAESERMGARYRLGMRVHGGARAGELWTLATSEGPLRARIVAIAAGAWSRALGAELGAASLPLRAARRHLFVLAHALDLAEPFVWDLRRELYLRPDRDGTLVCACDDEPVHEQSHDRSEAVSPGAEERMRRAFARWLPLLAGAPLVRAWACLRTHTPDGLPVVGPDPARPSLWWVAGLGGFGLGASWEIGRLAAAALAGDGPGPPPEVSPARFGTRR